MLKLGRILRVIRWRIKRGEDKTQTELNAKLAQDLDHFMGIKRSENATETELLPALGVQSTTEPSTPWGFNEGPEQAAELHSPMVETSLLDQIKDRGFRLDDMPIEALGLSPTVSCLKRANIQTIGQISNATRADLLRLVKDRIAAGDFGILLGNTARTDLPRLHRVGMDSVVGIQKELMSFLTVMLKCPEDAKPAMLDPSDAKPDEVYSPSEPTTILSSGETLQDISELDRPLVDASLLARIRDRDFRLGEVAVEAIGLLPLPHSLKRANIHTVEQLGNCTRMDLLRLRSIGPRKLEQIEKQLNSFLVKVLAEAGEKPATQLSFDFSARKPLLDSRMTRLAKKLGTKPAPQSAPQQQPNASYLRHQTYELATHLCVALGKHVPLSCLHVPPHVRRDIRLALGREPETLADLEQSVKGLGVDSEQDGEHGGTKNDQALGRAIRWLKSSTAYECVDDEINYVLGSVPIHHHRLSSLDKRERLILASRFRSEGELTLETVGKRLGITRERVRQIQKKVQKKLVARTGRLPLFYSKAALFLLWAQGPSATLATWAKKLQDVGLLKDANSLEALVAIAKATNNSELALPAEFGQPLRTHIEKRIPEATKLVLDKARKVCRNSGAVRAHSLTAEKSTKGDVEQILRMNGFQEVRPEWWTVDITECVPVRVAAKVIAYCGPVSPAIMRHAVWRHLMRSETPVPPSDILARVLEETGVFVLAGGLIDFTKLPCEKPNLTGPEQVFLNVVLSEGPVVSFETIYHRELEAGFSSGSVTSLLRYSPIVQKIMISLYTLLNAKYGDSDVREVQSRLTRVPANSIIRVRSNGVIEFETNAGTWLDYGGVLSSGPAARLKGEWKLINDSAAEGRLVVERGFIRGLSQVSKNLGIIAGDRIRIDFNTWTREAKMTKVLVNNEQIP